MSRKKKAVRKFAVREVGSDRRAETPARIRYTPSGAVLTFAGYGAYPYDCISKDEFPDAACYHSDSAWAAERVGRNGMPQLDEHYEVIG